MTHVMKKWSQNLRVDGRTIDFKLDTGSDVYTTLEVSIVVSLV